MNSPELKSGWKMVKFGEVVKTANLIERDPEGCGIERIVGLEHLDPENLHIRRWNPPEDGTSFTRKFVPGQTLFGKRRAYQRKIAYAEFEGICSGDILVFEPKNKNILLPTLLPFICQSDAFFDHALNTSAGSLSPRTSWTALQTFEFPLPPLEEQKHITEILWAADETLEKYQVAYESAINLRNQKFINEILSANWQTIPASKLSSAPITKGTTPRNGDVVEPANIPFIKVYNLTFSGELDFNVDPTFIDQNTHEGGLGRSKVIPGDILINIVGPPLGKIAVVPKEYDEWNINQAIARIRIDDEAMRRFFIAYFQTSYAQNWFERNSKKTSGQQNLTLKIVQDFPVPTPPGRELNRILNHFDLADCAINAASRQIKMLKQLIKSLINMHTTKV